MSQIPRKYDNPLDHVCYLISDWLSPYLKLVNTTPNQITTWSLCFGLVSVYALSRKTWTGVLLFTVFYLIQFLLDCMDGHYARKYQMISEIGDWYDHIKDVVLYFLVCYILVTQYNLPHYYGAITLVIILPILQYVYNGCVSVYRIGAPTQGVISSLTLGEKMCYHGNSTDQLTRNLSYLRWVGPGTCAVGICVVSVYLYYQTQIIS